MALRLLSTWISIPASDDYYGDNDVITSHGLIQLISAWRGAYIPQRSQAQLDPPTDYYNLVSYLTSGLAFAFTLGYGVWMDGGVESAFLPLYTRLLYPVSRDGVKKRSWAFGCVVMWVESVVIKRGAVVGVGRGMSESKV